MPFKQRDRKVEVKGAAVGQRRHRVRAPERRERKREARRFRAELEPALPLPAPPSERQIPLRKIGTPKPFQALHPRIDEDHRARHERGLQGRVRGLTGPQLAPTVAPKRKRRRAFLFRCPLTIPVLGQVGRKHGGHRAQFAHTEPVRGQAELLVNLHVAPPVFKNGLHPHTRGAALRAHQGAFHGDGMTDRSWANPTRPGPQR